MALVEDHPVGVDALNRLAAAVAEVERLEPRLLAARAEVRAALREAADAGVSPTVLSSVLKVSRQRVSQLLAADG